MCQSVSVFIKLFFLVKHLKHTKLQENVFVVRQISQKGLCRPGEYSCQFAVVNHLSIKLCHTIINGLFGYNILNGSKKIIRSHSSRPGKSPKMSANGNVLDDEFFEKTNL